MQVCKKERIWGERKRKGNYARRSGENDMAKQRTEDNSGKSD